MGKVSKNKKTRSHEGGLMVIYSLTGGGLLINLISVSNEVRLLINRLSQLCQLSLLCHNSLIWT